MADHMALFKNTDEVRSFLIVHDVGVKPETIRMEMDRTTQCLNVTFDLWTDYEWESMGRQNKMIGGSWWDDQD